LLRRLHGKPGGQVVEQLAQDLRDVDLRQQLAGLRLGNHARRAGHAGAPKK